MRRRSPIVWRLAAEVNECQSGQIGGGAVISAEIYPTKGVKALENFLSTDGVKNINA
jgi:hypothetical protein